VNIQAIQPNLVHQVADLSLEKNMSVNALSGNDPVAMNPEAIGTTKSDVQTKQVIHQINYIKQQLDKLMTAYPFFPPREHPNRLDLIHALNRFQEEATKSADQTGSPESGHNQRLLEHASDAEIVAALQNVKQHLNNIVVQTNQTRNDNAQQDAVLDIKI
jgi:hypothetical protein